jgi:hypothetical protein
MLIAAIIYAKEDGWWGIDHPMVRHEDGNNTRCLEYEELSERCLHCS